jgi:hypothetical protein
MVVSFFSLPLELRKERPGSVTDLLLMEPLLKRIRWLEAHTNIVETLPAICSSLCGLWALLNYNPDQKRPA